MVKIFPVICVTVMLLGPQNVLSESGSSSTSEAVRIRDVPKGSSAPPETTHGQTIRSTHGGSTVNREADLSSMNPTPPSSISETVKARDKGSFSSSETSTHGLTPRMIAIPHTHAHSAHGGQAANREMEQVPMTPPGFSDPMKARDNSKESSTQAKTGHGSHVHG